MKKINNTPTLRFPGFEGEWVEKRLEKLFSEFRSGNNITSTKIFDVGLYPVFGGNGLRGYANHFTHDGFYMLIGRQGALCGNINRTHGKAFISEHAIACKANDTSDTEWLAQRLDYYNLNRLSESSAQPGLSVNKLLRFKIFIPTLPEQQKIATFLTAVDSKISQLKKKHSLLEQYKKGVMQQIFSQQIRFKPSLSVAEGDGSEFPEWEEKKLGEVGKTFNGLTGKTKENFGSGKPYIQYKQIFDDSKIDISRFGLVDIGKNETQNRVHFGDAFFTVSSETPNEIGTASVLLDQVEELYLNSFCFGFRVNSVKNLSPYFLRYLFRSEIFRSEIVKLAQGSTRFNMSKVQLLKIVTNIPCLAEQTKIANFLSAIDDKINHCSKQIEKMELWKQGLLQQMFV